VRACQTRVTSNEGEGTGSGRLTINPRSLCARRLGTAPTEGARAEAGISTIPPRARNCRLVGFGLALVLAGVLPWILHTSHNSAAAVRSLAVLPLKNLSGDVSPDYFTDGMTEGLIMRLGQISVLRAISSRSGMLYKGADKPLAEIARELDVQAVVEGSVLRSGDRVRISTQLIRVPADEQMWYESYEGDLRDALALQSKVAQAIAEQIRATLSSRQRLWSMSNSAIMTRR
jgi:TolB-like protein